MLIRIKEHTNTTHEDFKKLFCFLKRYHLVNEDVNISFEKNSSPPELPEELAAVRVDASQEPDFVIHFLTGESSSIHEMLKAGPVRKLLVGPLGLPETLSHVCIPFETHFFREGWLRPLLKQVQHSGWRARLIHGSHDWIAQGIVTLADWFHLSSVKEALKSWLTAELEEHVQKLIQDFPETEVYSSVESLAKMMLEQDPRTSMLLGNLSGRLHLPHYYHGVNYGALLKESHHSGLFLP